MGVCDLPAQDGGLSVLDRIGHRRQGCSHQRARPAGHGYRAECHHGRQHWRRSVRVGRSSGYALVPGPATVLPFGEVLAVAAFRCNVQEASGISCLSEKSGRGFTFSADGFTFQYTDLPG